MGNIDKVEYDKLSENAMHIVGQVCRNRTSDHPIHVYNAAGAMVEEICEAMKYVIDTGWFSNELYARKALCNVDGVLVPIVLFTRSRKEFADLVKTGWYGFVPEFPLVIGVSHSENGYDGDVYIKLGDDSLVSLEEWKKLQK